MARKITTEIFISEMRDIHGDKYDYSKVDYKSASKDKVCIICPKHGEFWQLPCNHRAGYGCPKCASESRSIGLNEFIRRSKEKFGEKFDYSKVEWESTKSPITLICPIHGEFQIIPEHHLNSPTGCPKCSRNLPKKPVVEGIKRKDMREYSIWKGMKTRCTNPNCDDYDRYMGRGITCCDEWLNSFDKFYEDMGPCPENFSLDRIDPNGNYCKENCRWADYNTQAQNRGDFNLVFTYNNETHVLKEWARILNINYITLYNRVTRSNMSFEEAITYEKPLVEFNGEKKTLVEWCKIYNIKYQTVINRLHKHHWTIEEALLTPYKHKKIKIQDIV